MAYEQCRQCMGSGRFGAAPHTQRCAHCNGSGRIYVKDPLPQMMETKDPRTCFPGESPVLTRTGIRPICDLRPGDEVIGVDRSGLTTTVVTEFVAHRPRPVWELSFADGRSFRSTANHLILTDSGFRPVGSVTPERSILVRTDHDELTYSRVSSMQVLGEQPVFNIYVEPPCTFVVWGAAVSCFASAHHLRTSWRTFRRAFRARRRREIHDALGGLA